MPQIIGKEEDEPCSCKECGLYIPENEYLSNIGYCDQCYDEQYPEDEVE